MTRASYRIETAPRRILAQMDEHAFTETIRGTIRQFRTGLFLTRTRLDETSVIAILLHGQWWTTMASTAYERELLIAAVGLPRLRQRQYHVLLPNRERHRYGFGTASLRSAAFAIAHYPKGGLIETSDGCLVVYSPQFGWLVSLVANRGEWEVIAEVAESYVGFRETEHEPFFQPRLREVMTRLPELPPRETGMVLLRGCICEEVFHHPGP